MSENGLGVFLRGIGRAGWEGAGGIVGGGGGGVEDIFERLSSGL